MAEPQEHGLWSPDGVRRDSNRVTPSDLQTGLQTLDQDLQSLPVAAARSERPGPEEDDRLALGWRSGSRRSRCFLSRSARYRLQSRLEMQEPCNYAPPFVVLLLW